ncbi:hypothetical protein DL89DRAFT_254483 [Linderina pennispora]|uniref:Cation efflux protein transmembrane domain-containing protein n=1 Tax=Linderina pennispora TaxID=61395 RepID=A0A1Y1WM94_9FUNG|nr:uncharacterized protein DL89DRAFT_254483 [Linderina pennispora]ORX74690.1 hypothetical protein DL89DRAFT_254483 [Linderina pennispora]
MAHLGTGALVWVVGVWTGSLAQMTYASLVLYDAWALLLDNMPALLEFSDNQHGSSEYAFGLAELPTVLRFGNSLVLLYRALQAVKEGIEHIAVRGHGHGLGAGEFETYAHTSTGHNAHAFVSVLAVCAALAATVCAARLGNHHAAWEMRSHRQQPATHPMQHVVLNPCNAASLGAGVWVLLLALLAPAHEDSLMEPIACLVVAAAMAYAALPTCIGLARQLLLATKPEPAAAARQAAWQVARLPGVSACERCLVWSAAGERFVGVLRVVLLPACDSAAVKRQVDVILSASRLGDWTVEMRRAL